MLVHVPCGDVDSTECVLGADDPDIGTTPEFLHPLDAFRIVLTEKVEHIRLELLSPDIVEDRLTISPAIHFECIAVCGEFAFQRPCRCTGAYAPFLFTRGDEERVPHVLKRPQHCASAAVVTAE